MILKKIIISGFKSFCDKTEFDFSEGITCIVGPNGCGKSNVVDAFKWVLGEQSAKSLRGEQMMDMIFNGSATRRSSGLAQVDLVFDNADRSLNLDQPEVTIGRRLFRSGESDYLINAQSVRLKDIRELFFDTGVGVDAYSVIEQGKVDLLLQSNPEQRREIFEEAAGISKYKARRKEAQRKLERTQQNLLRLQDILDELQKRLRSVKLAATKARHFQEYDQRLRELRASHALAEYHRLTQEHESLQQEMTRLEDERVSLQAQLSRHEADQSSIASEILRTDQTLEEHHQRTTLLHSQLTTIEERIRLSQQHQTEQEELLQTNRRRAAEEQTRIQSLRDNIQTEQTRLPVLEAEHAAHQEKVITLTQQENDLANQITELQACLEDEKSGLIDLLHRSADLRNEIAAIEANHQSLAGQKLRLEARGGKLCEDLENVLHRKTVAQTSLTEIQSVVTRENQQLNEKQSLLEQTRSERSECLSELARLQTDHGAMFSELDVLKDLEQKMEGVDQAVRELLHRKTANPEHAQLAAIAGLVADVISTDVDHAPVIEAALERWAQHLVVTDSEAFLSLNGQLSDLKGRLHVLCADRLSPFFGGRDLSGEEGFIARAIDWVRYPEELEYVVRHLLGKTVVVETLADAVRLAESDVQNHEFITRKGEVVDSHGRLVLGPKSERTGLISRKSRIREIQQKLESIDVRLETLRDTSNRLQTQEIHLNHLTAELRGAMTDNITLRAEKQTEFQRALDEMQRLTQEQPLIAGELAMLENQMLQAMEKSTLNRESLRTIEEQNKRRESAVAEYQQTLNDRTRQRTAQQELLTQARVAAGQLLEKYQAAKETIQTLTLALGATQRSLDELAQHIEQCEFRLAESARQIDEATQEQTRLRKSIEEHEVDTLKVRRHRETLREASESLAELCKAARTALHDAEEQIHRQQMRFQEVVVRRDELILRTREELNLLLDQLYETYEPAQQDPSAVEREIQELRDKISRLGNINVDAITEQLELEQRLGFLETQWRDLDDSRRQLEDLIVRLNNESRERFTQTFEQVRSHFQEMFRKLFGGGKADLVLDPNVPDPLEAGIEILARPPGKELQSISLMSGGEKTLTTIALLMSIFQSKPSPFVFLDEVDAALDEANNERFNRIVQEFLAQSQFIVITHSKRTMQMASTLYGVTMQEPGVSRRVSVRFENHSTPESAVA